ncbi:M28 family peptidase [Halorubrum luteum]
MSKSYDLLARDEPELSEWERTLHDSVSKSEPWTLVEEFSQLRRLSPSDDEQRAAELLEERFEEYGIPFERYDPTFWLSVPEAATVRTVGDTELTFSGREAEFKEEPPAVKTLAYSNDGTVSGDVVQIDIPRAGGADEILGKTSVDLSEYDLEGKIALVDSMLLAKGFFEAIEEQGAEGVVMIHPNEDEPHISTAMPIWGAIPRPDQREMLPDIVYAVVSRSVGDKLLEAFASTSDLQLEVETDVTTGWFECPLVVADIPGEADPRSDDFVLLHGHLDSWYYGVTDNATGNAGMVECARVLNDHRDRLRRDLRIAFWPAHEGGRYGGSTWFVDQFAHELYDHCVAHVNFDSPGVKDATEFNMTAWNVEGTDLCREAIDDVTGKDAEWSRPPRAGDYAFFNLGITGLMMLSSGIPSEVRDERGYHAVGGGGGNSDAWHLTTDTLDKADPEVLVRDIRVHLVLLARLLSEPIIGIDHRDAVANHLETVREYNEAAGDHFDLSPVEAELEALEAAVEELYRRIEAEEIDPAQANEAIKTLSRRLIPLDFTNAGRFDQDPAKFRPPYPRLVSVLELPDLKGNEYKFRQTNLRRAVNEVVHELREAGRALPTGD